MKGKIGKLTVLSGIPGSGKSEYAAYCRYNFDNLEVVSTDEVRKDLYGNEEEQGDGWIVFSTAYDRILKALKQGKDVIFDATNVKRSGRRKIIKYFRKVFNDIYMECIYFNVPLDVCLERNSERGRVVPDEVVEKMHEEQTIPSMDEGWNNIMCAFPIYPC